MTDTKQRNATMSWDKEYCARVCLHVTVVQLYVYDNLFQHVVKLQALFRHFMTEFWKFNQAPPDILQRKPTIPTQSSR